MNPKPQFWTSVRAKIGGEISAEALEAYRGAGGAVYGLLEEAETRRRELMVSQKDGWSADPATQAFFVATWNAYMLQTLGDALLDADYEADPGTVGYVPPVTAEQARRFYDGVEAWLSHARAAQSNPGYRLQMNAPAALPPWVVVEPCPPAHLAAMGSATEKIRLHAELAVHDCAGCAGHEKTAGRLQEQVAAMTASADYAASLYQQRAGAQLHERIERSLKGAIDTAYRLGQIAAMPSLDNPAQAPVPRPFGRPGPGEPGFDKWCLTDARTRPDWKRDPAAARSLDMLWAADPDPAITLAIQGQIDAAFGEGRIGYARDRTGRPLGHYMCCPFSAIYQTVWPVRIAGTLFRPGQQFTFDVSAEELAEGGPFKRRLLTAWFSPTDELDYCNPGEG